MSGTRLAIIYSRASAAIEAPLVSVEIHISNGLPRLSIVGLVEAEVKESKDRVRSAIINSEYEFPTRRITINLAPADLPKEGGRFDLAIALGILIASDQLKVKDLEEYEFAGELALSGELRAISGTLPFAMNTRKAKRKLIVPMDNACEAVMSGDNVVYAAKSLRQVCEHLQKIQLIEPYIYHATTASHADNFSVDMAEIQGQLFPKRAMEIAAAGRHSVLLIGPPGSGKTMLASRLPSIMPTLSIDEALEVAAVYSLNQRSFSPARLFQRPFRTPHHTTSAVALVGGGSYPKPGEISLAHHGVLFLDELPEFDRHVLEVLREPLEAGSILISRANRKAVFPAQFQLIAAMNPCPCGQLGNPKQHCNCTSDQITRYQSRISGPLLERIDMQIEMPSVSAELLTEISSSKNEASATIKQRVQAAMLLQQQRNKKSNSMLSNTEVKKYCAIDKECQKLFKRAIETLNLSARSFYRVLKVSRTIADLGGAEQIQVQHIQEALAFRSKLQKPWL